MSISSLLTLFTLITFSVGPNLAQAQDNLFRLEHTRYGKRILNPDIRPDGKEIIYLVEKKDWEENEYVRDLWIVNTDTKENRQLTFDREHIRGAQWTPDGQAISFIEKGRDDKPQIFILSMRGGEAQQITSSKTGIVAYRWSPEGDRIAFVANDTVPTESGEDKFNKSYEVGYDSYLAEDEPVFAHIWLCDADGNNAVQLTDNETGVNSWAFDMSWSGDGTYLVYTSVPSPYRSKILEKSLIRMDVESGEKKMLIPSGRQPGDPLVTRDGRKILYEAPRGDEIAFSSNGLFMMSSDGHGSEESVLDVDRNVERVAWLDDDHFIVVVNDGTLKSTWISDLNGNKSKIELGEIVPLSLTTNREGEIAIVGSTSHSPSELYYLKEKGSEIIGLTNVNTWTDTLQMGTVTTVKWQTHDGFEADGVLTYPVNYTEGEQYPLVLAIHGGPMGSSDMAFEALALAMASEGWLVFQPNYRGSNNLGNAYQRAVINDAGEGPGKDVMAGIDKLVSMGIVDTSRMAVSGWSYGGYMTVWLTSHYDVWDAAVAGAAVTDWFDWYSMADLNIWSGLGLGGSPWTNDNAENYRKQSPITYAHNIKAPTLILSNTYDERVTVSQSYKLFHNLKDNGVETQFIAYPLKGHFPGDPVNQLDVMERWIGWIRERL